MYVRMIEDGPLSWLWMRRCSRLGWALFIPFVLLMALQLRQRWVCHRDDGRGEVRGYFREVHGIEILGPRSAVEGNPGLLQMVDAVLHQERASGGLGALRAVEVLSESWHEQPVHAWVLRYGFRNQAWYRAGQVTLADRKSTRLNSSH